MRDGGRVVPDTGKGDLAFPFWELMQYITKKALQSRMRIEDPSLLRDF